MFALLLQLIEMTLCHLQGTEGERISLVPENQDQRPFFTKIVRVCIGPSSFRDRGKWTEFAELPRENGIL